MLKTNFETLGFGHKVFVFLIIFHVIIFISGFLFLKNNKIEKEKKKKIIKVFLICYILTAIIISPFAVMYFITHSPVSDLVPPSIIVRLLDDKGEPIKNAYCNADIETEYFKEKDKPLEKIEMFRELGCYGREPCSKENYLGYYKLNITGDSYNEFNWLFFKFWKLENAVKGDFNVSVVCYNRDYISSYVFNKSDFPCSIIPLTGNYIAPSAYCSDESKIIKEHVYNMKSNEYDEYDFNAINFIKENYQDKVILANSKVEIALDYYGLKPVGLLQDKKGYGDPYVFNEFMISDCERRLELINQHNVDLILSRFELEKCEFMKEIYINEDYIYEVIR